MTAPFDKSSVIEFFLIEAGEHLQNLNRGLLSLEKDPTDIAMIDELFRAAHTLKGSAAMMGFQGISDVAHKSEDMLGMFRAGAAEIRRETLDFLFDSVDAVKLMVDGVAAGRREDPLIVETIMRAYQGIVASVKEPAPPAPPPAAKTPPAPKASTDITLKQELEEAKKTGIVEKRSVARRATDSIDLEKHSIRVSIDRLDNLMNLVGEMIVGRNRLGRQIDLIKSLREELAFTQNRLLHDIRRFEEKYEYTLTVGAPLPREEADPSSADFPELEFDRYDDFNLLSRKLTEITNDTNEIMTQLAGVFDSFELDTARISTITTGMQNEITMARMVEMDKLYQKFQRPVRDLAREEGKEIKLVVSGGETKVDRTIFEIITDPLMHMIRNAVSHGLETVAERRLLGKEPAGSLILTARHEGDSIVIQIEDDGRGMDPAVLRQTAADKGFLREAEARSLSDAEAVNLIFRPGFSTASRVGKMSGRGVGMDVVSTHLSRINGRIEIKTEAGVGTKFVIRLPLTLAIAQALIVKLGDQEMAVPMNFVEETTKFAGRDIQRTASGEMVNLRGTLLKLYKLNELLGVGRFPIQDDAHRHPALILGTAEKRIALMVEEITGREEIVVKSLGEFLKGVKLFSGASISGEGDVRLIINVSPLFGEEDAVRCRAFVCETEETAASGAAKRKPRVLVVDDSISVRKYVERFLVRAGYEVEAAPDGVEALRIMDRMKFDAVITDLEMPVMHGCDFMAEMRKSPDLMNIPVIVLTFRTGDKHRKKATEMGARDCLVKPVGEQDVIVALSHLLPDADPASPGMRR
jgi:chemotaxis protein histidine kinase CheA/CheY-like chemotaxis protein